MLAVLQPVKELLDGQGVIQLGHHFIGRQQAQAGVAAQRIEVEARLAIAIRHAAIRQADGHQEIRNQLHRFCLGDDSLHHHGIEIEKVVRRQRVLCPGMAQLQPVVASRIAARDAYQIDLGGFRSSGIQVNRLVECAIDVEIHDGGAVVLAQPHKDTPLIGRELREEDHDRARPRMRIDVQANGGPVADQVQRRAPWHRGVVRYRSLQCFVFSASDGDVQHNEQPLEEDP